MVAIVRTVLGHDPEAIECAQRACDVGFAPPPFQPSIFAAAARCAGRYADAGRRAADCLDEVLRDSPIASALRQGNAAVDNRDLRGVALDALARSRAGIEPSALERFLGAQLIACYTLLGAIDLAHDTAEQWLDQCSKHGIIGMLWGTVWMPEMAPFRQHPRFQSLVRGLGMTAYWEARGPPDGHRLSAGVLVAE